MNSAIPSTGGKIYSSRVHTDPIPLTRRIQELYLSFARDFFPVLSQIYEIMLVL
jgi:hypothetical protein